MLCAGLTRESQPVRGIAAYEWSLEGMRLRVVHSPIRDPWQQAADGIDLAADRRRAGRPAHVSPALIPLLRGQFEAGLPPEPELALPRAMPIDRELAMGIGVAFALLFVGIAIRSVA